MTTAHAIRTAAPWMSLAGASALMATIVVIAPEVGREVLLALIGAWAVLAAVRVVIFIGLTRQFFNHYRAARAAR